ncbi:hypothetical protein ACWD3I_25140 [Streptomyces sp. NPDC002817]|uniref:hypothetical protein n=1 Tax=Streptomyces sp. NPDC088357 TaxID=3154655 RepID=UPI003415ADE0
MAREAEHVARFTHTGKTHDIQPGWSYSRISEARTKCRMNGPFAIESLASGRLLEVTCTLCAAAD